MLGLTNNTIDVVNRTMATTLLPGVNIVGAANLFIFQRFRNAHVSVIGLFDVSALEKIASKGIDDPPVLRIFSSLGNQPHITGPSSIHVYIHHPLTQCLHDAHLFTE
jgi:hypothetical protein